MNGFECGLCYEHPCVCDQNKKAKIRDCANFLIEEGFLVGGKGIEHPVIAAVWEAIRGMGKYRRKIFFFLFPKFKSVMQTLNDYYWS